MCNVLHTTPSSYDMGFHKSAKPEMLRQCQKRIILAKHKSNIPLQLTIKSKTNKHTHSLFMEVEQDESWETR